MSIQDFNLYVGFCQRRGNDPLHWMLLAAPKDSDRCIWYHVTGGPTKGVPRTLVIAADKRVHSFGIASKVAVGSISSQDLNKLKSSAQSIPLQRCQCWICSLLGDLERKGLIQAGWSAHFQALVEPSPHEGF